MKMTRTPLKERSLPGYTRKEEIANMTTHIVGAGVGVVVFALSIWIAFVHQNVWSLVSGAVYGLSLILLYTVSSVYHGLIPSLGKKVMQVIDHCTIYTLIAGTYTPIVLCALRPAYPRLAWTLLAAEWGTAAVATVFSAIDHKKFHAVEMTAYLVMGWLCVAAYRPVVECLSRQGFWWLLAGGVAYTLGAALYGLGRKRNPIYHTVFHVFVDVGSILHAVCVLCYVL